MTPLHLKILLHYHCVHSVMYAFDDPYHANSNTVKEYTKQLVADGLIEREDEFYSTTEKGKFYVEALCSLVYLKLKMKIKYGSIG